MRDDAARAGIDLLPVSSFRDFERQRRIWNAKYRGERPALDRRGRPLDSDACRRRRGSRRILLVVGPARGEPPSLGQRHRCRRRQRDRRRLRAAARAAGIRRQADHLQRCRDWLAAHMRRYGFYRPYARAGRGVQPEPWHLSFAPVARRALPALTRRIARRGHQGRGGRRRGRDPCGPAVDPRRYVLGVDAPPRMRSRWARLSSG